MAISLPDSDRFDSYEKEFKALYDDLSARIEDPQAQAPSVSELQRLVDEGYELLDQLALEVQSIPSGSRSSYNSKIRNYRSNLDKAKRKITTAGQEADRSALFANRSTNDDDVGSSQRQQLLSGQQSLERSSDRLRESQRVANETEFIGASILSDLRGQREQIGNAHRTLIEADGNVDRSLRTLRTMARRMAANKIITYAIIAVLVVLIIFVILSKFW